MGHATHNSGKRNVDRSGSADHEMGQSRNRNVPEDAEDDTQEMDSELGQAKLERFRRKRAEG